MTAGDAVKRALRLIGALDPGVDPSSQELADGLTALNSLTASWSAGRNAIHAPVTVTHALTDGVASYTIGTGGAINTPRPKRIIEAWVRLGSTDYHLEVIAVKNFAALGYKSTPGTPDRLYYEAGYPLASLTLYPVPTSGYTLHLKLWASLPTYATAATDLGLPPEYERAIAFNLAADLAPEYGREVPATVASIATASFAAVKTLNSHPVSSVSSNPISSNPFGGRRYNINGDT